MASKQTVSIKTISEYTGLSIATVSRVINKSGSFTPETYNKGQEAVRQLGYVPNAMARGLRKNSIPLVGIIVPDIINEFFSRIVLYIQLEMAKHGYSVFICNTNESEDQELMYLDSLQTMRISGLVCISGHDAEDERWPNVPTVYIDRNPARRIQHSSAIESDNVSGGFQAGREVCRRGCERIALLRDVRPVSTVTKREQGYRQALADAGIAVDDSLILTTDKISEKTAYDAVAYALQSGKRFDGIFCTTDWLAMGALRALYNVHLTVPRDVRVVGYDDISVASYSAMPITTIRQDTDEMSRLAVEELILMMEGKPPRRDHWIVPVSLIRRETT